MKQADLRDIFNMVTKGVCTSTAVVSPDRSSPAPSTSLTITIPENTENDCNDPEPAHEGDIQM
jgi:hypothetical protein